MLKKISLVLVLTFALMMFAGCTGATTTSTTATSATTAVTTAATTKADDGIKKVAFLTPSAGTGFMAFLATEVEKAFKAGGYEWNIGISDGDSKKQIEQIENYITLGVDTMVVMAVEPTSLKDVLQRAKDAGIYIINFTTDPGVGDVFAGADEELVGSTVAEIASAWIDKTFPNAKDGEIKVAIMEFRDTPEASHRSDGIAKIADFNKKVSIVKVVQGGNATPAAQAAAENLFLTNPDISAVLCYNSAVALGVNSYVMTPGSVVTDKAKFGAFGADQDKEVCFKIRDSITDLSVLRGATQIGGDIMEVIANIVKYSDQLMAGETVAPRDIAPILKIDASNVAEKITELGYDEPAN